jgi:hypothetical protein
MQIRTKYSLALIAALGLCTGASLAQAKDVKPLTPQQQRMSDCSKQSKGLKGDERRAFMSSCLKGGNKPAGATQAQPVAQARSAQQNRMKTCNADAKARALKGAERKHFMSDCLSGESVAAN